MANVAVIGTQWGDEGKGKIVDWLADRADVVVRYQGGHNAGHTLVVDGVCYKLSLFPSGLIRGKLSIIGNGVVVDPYHFISELGQLRSQGVMITPEILKISENAPLVLSVHRDLDSARENSTSSLTIGTTQRGIGPAYEDKVGRRAIRVIDLAEPDTLMVKVRRLLDHHNPLRRGMGAEEIEPQTLYDELMRVADDVVPFMDCTWRLLEERYQMGQRILFEGAQGAWLDNDFGTYPYVTSSNTVSGQVFTGSGMRPDSVHYVLGVAKAYTTRVGEGPFPTEQIGGVGDFLRTQGNEFGVVTGRQRRCGWFDSVLVRQMVSLCGLRGIALTKLDVLDDLDEIKICVAYELDGKRIDYLPCSSRAQACVKPVYDILEGWKTKTAHTRSLQELPKQALQYVYSIEKLIGIPVVLLSTSPKRTDTILIKDPFLD